MAMDTDVDVTLLLQPMSSRTSVGLEVTSEELLVVGSLLYDSYDMSVALRRWPDELDPSEESRADKLCSVSF